MSATDLRVLQTALQLLASDQEAKKQANLSDGSVRRLLEAVNEAGTTIRIKRNNTIDFLDPAGTVHVIKASAASLREFLEVEWIRIRTLPGKGHQLVTHPTQGFLGTIVRGRL